MLPLVRAITTDLASLARDLVERVGLLTIILAVWTWRVERRRWLRLLALGALGTVIASGLARAGVGKLRIVDRDFIEYHNLQRQMLFDEDDIAQGLPKALAAERHLRKVNSEIAIEGINADVNYTNIERLIAGADVILDGLDNTEARFLINDAALKHNIPWVYGGAIAATGMTMTVVPGKSACFRCITAGPASAGTVLTCAARSRSSGACRSLR